jgi:hypothetical protein
MKSWTVDEIRSKGIIDITQKLFRMRLLDISVEALRSGSRCQKVSVVRSQLAKKLVEEWGLSLTKTGRHLGVSPSPIAKILYRLDKNKSN